MSQDPFEGLLHLEEVLEDLQRRNLLSTAPVSKDEFLSLHKGDYLLVEARDQLNALGYWADPPKKPKAPEVARVLLDFQMEAGLRERGWLGPQTWAALRELATLDSVPDLARWRLDDGTWRPCLQRAAMLRLRKIGFFHRTISPAHWQSASDALRRFSATVTGFGWLVPGDPEAMLVLLFDHYGLMKQQTSFLQDTPFFFADPETDESKLLDGLQALDEQLLALSPEEENAILEDEDFLAGDPEAAFAFSDPGAPPEPDPPVVAFDILQQLADNDSDRLEKAIQEARANPATGGLRDGIRKAFDCLRGWGSRLLGKLKAGKRAGIAVLRQAARVLHNWGAQALSAVRAAYGTVVDYLLGNLHTGPHAQVWIQHDLDMVVWVDRSASVDEIRTATDDVRLFGQRFRTATRLLSVVMDLLFALLSGIGWATFLVRLVRRLADMWSQGGLPAEMLKRGRRGMAGALG